MSKNKWGLTPKMVEFCEQYIITGNGSESYRNSYKAEGMADSSIRTEAWKLLERPDVTQYVEHLQSEKSSKNRLSGQALRDKVLNGLLLEAEGCGQDGARIRAWELIGKLDGVDAFGASKVETKQINIDSSKTALEQAVSDALEDPTVTNLLKFKAE
jgi:hypothetical protein